MEFDPSNLKIDPELFKSFESMMQNKEADPQMDKFMASMMEDAARLQQKEYNIGDEEDDSDLSEGEKNNRIGTTIEVEQGEEEEDLEALKSTKAAGGIATQSSQRELEDRARNIFGKKKPE